MEALGKEIAFSNGQALVSGSRMPEVVEWYFRTQTEVTSNTQTVLGHPQAVLMQYAAPGRRGSSKTSALTIGVRTASLGLVISTSALPRLQ